MRLSTHHKTSIHNQHPILSEPNLNRKKELLRFIKDKITQRDERISELKTDTELSNCQEGAKYTHYYTNQENQIRINSLIPRQMNWQEKERELEDTIRQHHLAKSELENLNERLHNCINILLKHFSQDYVSNILKKIQGLSLSEKVTELEKIIKSNNQHTEETKKNQEIEKIIAKLRSKNYSSDIIELVLKLIKAHKTLNFKEFKEKLIFIDKILFKEIKIQDLTTHEQRKYILHIEKIGFDKFVEEYNLNKLKTTLSRATFEDICTKLIILDKTEILYFEKSKELIYFMIKEAEFKDNLEIDEKIMSLFRLIDKAYSIQDGWSPKTYNSPILMSKLNNIKQVLELFSGNERYNFAIRLWKTISTDWAVEITKNITHLIPLFELFEKDKFYVGSKILNLFSDMPQNASFIIENMPQFTNLLKIFRKEEQKEIINLFCDKNVQDKNSVTDIYPNLDKITDLLLLFKDTDRKIIFEELIRIIKPTKQYHFRSHFLNEIDSVKDLLKLFNENERKIIIKSVIKNIDNATDLARKITASYKFIAKLISNLNLKDYEEKEKLFVYFSNIITLKDHYQEKLVNNLNEFHPEYKSIFRILDEFDGNNKIKIASKILQLFRGDYSSDLIKSFENNYQIFRLFQDNEKVEICENLFKLYLDLGMNAKKLQENLDEFCNILRMFPDKDKINIAKCIFEIYKNDPNCILDMQLFRNILTGINFKSIADAEEFISKIHFHLNKIHKLNIILDESYINFVINKFTGNEKRIVVLKLLEIHRIPKNIQKVIPILELFDKTQRLEVMIEFIDLFDKNTRMSVFLENVDIIKKIIEHTPISNRLNMFTKLLLVSKMNPEIIIDLNKLNKYFSQSIDPQKFSQIFTLLNNNFYKSFNLKIIFNILYEIKNNPNRNLSEIIKEEVNKRDLSIFEDYNADDKELIFESIFINNNDLKELVKELSENIDVTDFVKIDEIIKEKYSPDVEPEKLSFNMNLSESELKLSPENETQLVKLLTDNRVNIRSIEEIKQIITNNTVFNFIKDLNTQNINELIPKLRELNVPEKLIDIVLNNKLSKEVSLQSVQNYLLRNNLKIESNIIQDIFRIVFENADLRESINSFERISIKEKNEFYYKLKEIMTIDNDGILRDTLKQIFSDDNTVKLMEFLMSKSNIFTRTNEILGKLEQIEKTINANNSEISLVWGKKRLPHLTLGKIGGTCFGDHLTILLPKYIAPASIIVNNSVIGNVLFYKPEESNTLVMIGFDPSIELISKLSIAKQEEFVNNMMNLIKSYAKRNKYELYVSADAGGLTNREELLPYLEEHYDKTKNIEITPITIHPDQEYKIKSINPIKI